MSVITGPAALVCAETLRQNCYQGRIIMVTKDNLPPLDKPKLSKVRATSGEETCNLVCLCLVALACLNEWIFLSVFANGLLSTSFRL